MSEPKQQMGGAALALLEAFEKDPELRRKMLAEAAEHRRWWKENPEVARQAGINPDTLEPI
jgi:hypothetical protein